MRLQIYKPCRIGGKHKIKSTKTNYNLNNVECLKCGDSMPNYIKNKSTVIKRLGTKSFTCSSRHTGKCADNLELFATPASVIWVVQCVYCGEMIDEEKFV